MTDGVIFDYSRFMDIRNRDVALPANEYRQFKVVVEQELDDRESPLRELIRGRRGKDGKKDTRVEITRNLRTPFRIDGVELWRTVESEGGTEAETFAIRSRASRSSTTRRRSSRESRSRAVANRSRVSRSSTASRNFSRNGPGAGSGRARRADRLGRGWPRHGRDASSSARSAARSCRSIFPNSDRSITGSRSRTPTILRSKSPASTRGNGLPAGLPQVPGPDLPARVWLGHGREPAVRHGGRAGFAEPRLSSRDRETGTASIQPRLPRAKAALLALLNSPVFLTLAIVVMVLVLAWALFRAGMRIKKLPQQESLDRGRFPSSLVWRCAARSWARRPSWPGRAASG